MGPLTCSLAMDAEVIPNRAILKLLLKIFFSPLDVLRRLEYNFAHLLLLSTTLQVLPPELLLFCVGGCSPQYVPSFSHGALSVPALKNSFWRIPFLLLLRDFLSFWSMSSPVFFAVPGACFGKFLPKE